MSFLPEYEKWESEIDKLRNQNLAVMNQTNSLTRNARTYLAILGGFSNYLYASSSLTDRSVREAVAQQSVQHGESTDKIFLTLRQILGIGGSEFSISKYIVEHKDETIKKIVDAHQILTVLAPITTTRTNVYEVIDSVREALRPFEH